MNSNHMKQNEQNHKSYQLEQNESQSQALLEIVQQLKAEGNQYSIQNQDIKLNNIDIREGDFQRQQWILQDKFSQKSVQQSLNSIDQDQMQYFKDESITKEVRKDEKYNKNEDKNLLNGSSISKNLESSSTVIQVRQGRKTIFRPKRDESIVDSYKNKKTKKADQSKKLNYQSERDFDPQRDEVLTQEAEHKNKKEKVWISSFFNILLFVNRFLVRNKQKLLFFHPNQLQSHQAEAINDVAYQFNNEFENRNIVKDNIFRSKFKIVRRLRIWYLIFRKKTKLCVQPFISFQNKAVATLKRVLDPIPVILPYHNFSITWDLIILIMILINAIKIPYELSFNSGQISLGVVSFSSRLIFFLDFFMMFNTAYYENGVLQKQRSKIFIHFLKNRLVIEGCAYMCLWINPLGITILRIFFLIKFIQLYDTIEKLAEAFQLSYKYNFIVNLIVLFIEVVLLCHLFACIWYSIGNYQINNGLTPNWIQKYSADDNNQYQQYIDSIYFSVVTIGTIGFGDIVPVSILEKGCLTAMSIFSCGIFAYILSNIQNVYREYQMKQEGYNNKLSELNNYMFNREVNPTLQQMARKYLKYVHDQGYQQGVMPCETLNSLSISLREEIKEDIFKKSIENIKFLKQYSSQLKFQLSRKMIEINYGPDEFIMKSGQFQNPCLYYILKGQVDVCLDKGFKQSLQQQNSLNTQVFNLQNQTDVIGLYEFTTQTQVCMTNARSVGVTTVHVLALDDFLEVINQNASDKEIYFQQKDLINLYKNYEQIKLFCYSCKSSQHLIKDCPIFFYKPNKQKIVNKHIKDQNYLKKNIRNEQNSRFNSLAIVNQLRQDILQFCEENESDIDSLYQSQSTIKDTLQNIDVNDGVLAQQSSLTPLKPKSEINLRLLNDRNLQKEDNTHFEDELKKKQSEKQERFSKLNALQQEASFLECSKLNEDTKFDSLLNQNFICSERNISEKPLDKTDGTKNNDMQVLKNSFSNFGLISKKNSVTQMNNMQQSQLQQRISVSILEKNLNLINQKTNHEIQIANEKQKNIKSLQSLKTQHIHAPKRNSIRYSQLQNVLNLLTSNIVKKENNPQEEVQEELIIDTIRTYKYYMPHNNSFTVIKSYNKHQNKKKEKEKQKLLEIVSTNLQHRSIFQKV
ncbi:hypothetical protein ABPG74_007357 [Tetrahymena malaccensis]